MNTLHKINSLSNNKDKTLNHVSKIIKIKYIHLIKLKMELKLQMKILKLKMELNPQVNKHLKLHVIPRSKAIPKEWMLTKF
jgi:hypothetical protein